MLAKYSTCRLCSHLNPDFLPRYLKCKEIPVTGGSDAGFLSTINEFPFLAITNYMPSSCPAHEIEYLPLVLSN